MSAVLSQAAQRDAIVDALDGVTADVDGSTVTIAATPTRPPTLAPYQAWPVWTATRPTAKCVVERDWQVIVTLPGADAQTWTVNGDALTDAVADALAEWHLTRIEPGQVNVSDAGTAMPVLIYTVDI
jgi:hypothetical protein